MSGLRTVLDSLRQGRLQGLAGLGKKWRFQVRGVRLALTLGWGHMGRVWSWACTFLLLKGAFPGGCEGALSGPPEP